jgi:hypothetical protein
MERQRPTPGPEATSSRRQIADEPIVVEVALRSFKVKTISAQLIPQTQGGIQFIVYRASVDEMAVARLVADIKDEPTSRTQDPPDLIVCLLATWVG